MAMQIVRVWLPSTSPPPHPKKKKKKREGMHAVSFPKRGKLAMTSSKSSCCLPTSVIYAGNESQCLRPWSCWFWAVYHEEWCLQLWCCHVGASHWKKAIWQVKLRSQLLMRTSGLNLMQPFSEIILTELSFQLEAKSWAIIGSLGDTSASRHWRFD